MLSNGVERFAPSAKEPRKARLSFPSAIPNLRRTTMSEKNQAISGTVTGNDQHVGFRAMIMKQAIEYNLAGFTKNLPNDVVSFVLQGDGKRLNDAVSAIQEGTKKSSDIKVNTAEDKVDPSLNAFTIFDWTSTTRNITTPYTLVFHLRPDDGKLAPANVKTVWRGILQSTLKGADLKKLGPDD
jgi:acylphosphatase